MKGEPRVTKILRAEVRREGLEHEHECATSAQIWRLNTLGLLPEALQAAGALLVDELGDPIPFALSKADAGHMLSQAKERGLWVPGKGLS